MKCLHSVIFALFLFSLPAAKAQQNHFIYIQTENKQPFYVKLDKKLYSSTVSGYLLVSKLKEGNYNLTIGFPKSEWKEQNLICAIDNNDKGYLLKNFGNKGWGLFNLQTLDLVMSGNVENDNNSNIEVVNKTDAFSNMLSNVVNDSTIRQTETVKEEVKVPAKQTEKSTVGTDVVKDAVVVEATKEKISPNEASEATKTAVVVKEAGKTEPVNDPIAENKNNRSVITRSSINQNAGSTEMIYIDEVNGQKDTIIISIPAVKNSVTVAEVKAVENEKSKEKPNSETLKQDNNPKDNKFLDIELPNPNTKDSENKSVENKVTQSKDTSKVEAKYSDTLATEPGVQKSVMINSDCKNFATDEDFLKLRKKMAGEDNEDDMIMIAKKLFKTKCFSVEQVKNLSVLFLKDSGKYAFFDMAYPFVSDSHNFGSLQIQLSETYFINRFQVMIRH